MKQQSKDILPEIKLALRISHSKLDDDIIANIDAAIAEMIRRGTPATAARNLENSDILAAIRLYCRKEYWINDAARYERLQKAWDVKIDEIRRHYRDDDGRTDPDTS